MLSREKYTCLVKVLKFPGAASLFRTLVARGADPKRAARDNTLLYLAAGSDDTTLLGILLQYGFRANDTVLSGDYPLNQALAFRCFNTLKMLIEHGANVNVGLPETFFPHYRGLTALMQAAFEDDEVSDRKSTRLNSSHQIISYAVFCLKKKKKNKRAQRC